MSFTDDFNKALQNIIDSQKRAATGTTPLSPKQPGIFSVPPGGHRNITGGTVQLPAGTIAVAGPQLTVAEINEKLEKFFPSVPFYYGLLSGEFVFNFPQFDQPKYVSVTRASTFIMNSVSDDEAERKFREFFGLEVLPLPETRDPKVCWNHDFVEVTLFHTPQLRCRHCDIKKSEVKE